MSSDLIAHYLAHTGLCAIAAVSDPDTLHIRLVASRNPKAKRLPPGFSICATWWAPDDALADNLVGHCYDLAVANGVPRSRQWLTAASREADGLIQAAAVRLVVPLRSDREMRRQAQAELDKIEVEMEGRRRSGELKAVNRDYAEARAGATLRGERGRTYGDFMLALKKQAIEDAGRRTRERS